MQNILLEIIVIFSTMTKRSVGKSETHYWRFQYCLRKILTKLRKGIWSLRTLSFTVQEEITLIEILHNHSACSSGCVFEEMEDSHIDCDECKLTASVFSILEKLEKPFTVAEEKPMIERSCRNCNKNRSMNCVIQKGSSRPESRSCFEWKEYFNVILRF